MADLYTRLKELEGMTRLLIDDLTFLKPLVGLGNPTRPRRKKRIDASTPEQSSPWWRHLGINILDESNTLLVFCNFTYPVSPIRVFWNVRKIDLTDIG